MLKNRRERLENTLERLQLQAVHKVGFASLFLWGGTDLEVVA